MTDQTTVPASTFQRRCSKDVIGFIGVMGEAMIAGLLKNSRQ
jgi:hypothetical protein